MFGLFGKKKKKESIAAGNALSPGIASSIYSTIGSKGVPSMPQAAEKAFRLATDPKAEARDFIDVIESDEALSARVLKIANSVYFDRGKKSHTIEEAVLVIGINELKCLLNASTLSELFPSKNQFRGILWAHDIATALVSRELAAKFLPEKKDEAFLAGLMHDIGKLLLLQRAEEQYNQVIKKVEAGVGFQKAEEEFFPFTHTEVGQLIGERWNFTAELLEVIRNHHAVQTDLTHSIGGIVAAANSISHALGLGFEGKFTRLQKSYEETLPNVMQELGVRGNDQKEMLERLKKSFELEYDLYAGKIG